MFNLVNAEIGLILYAFGHIFYGFIAHDIGQRDILYYLGLHISGLAETVERHYYQIQSRIK